MTAKNKDTATAVWTMLAIVAVIFVAELVVMLVLSAIGETRVRPSLAVVDAAILSLLVAPPVYLLILLPIRRELEKRVKAENLAEDMSKLAITDSLTRIMNRRGITVALLDSMAQSDRYQTPLTVVMADIDHFKRINDQFGHDAGDRALLEVANALSEELRMPDKVGRYGGEEFLILFPHTGLVQGKKIADRIRLAMAKRKITLSKDQRTAVTLSFGLVQYRPGEDLEQLMSRTDRALFDAKEGGRNRVVAQKLSGKASR